MSSCYNQDISVFVNVKLSIKTFLSLLFSSCHKDILNNVNFALKVL